ncbi:hypothetical protein CRBSH125_14090 [Afipia carboxidovorans]|nr:hypothetical protein CRBSH125_14090 [Afipia carboxidovorans]
MGKITGFLEFERHDRGYKPVADRITNYDEFVIPLSEKELRDQAARCMNCGVPYCHGTGSVAPGTPGCPVNNQIPDWNDLVYKGNWEEASRNLHSTNNFPDFTGRICPAPCEASCTLNIIESPVTIKSIEHAIVERAWESGWLAPEIATEKTGRKVAVVGSGPAGRPARNNSRASAMRCMCSRNTPRRAGFCATAFPTSSWRSASSTAASNSSRPKVSCSTATRRWVVPRPTRSTRAISSRPMTPWR